jgi:hypothetical protein
MDKESNWNLIRGKRTKTKTDFKRGVSYGDMSGFVVVLLQNMQVLIPLFVLLVVDVESMNRGFCSLPRFCYQFVGEKQ